MTIVPSALGVQRGGSDHERVLAATISVSPARAWSGGCVHRDGRGGRRARSARASRRRRLVRGLGRQSYVYVFYNESYDGDYGATGSGYGVRGGLRVNRHLAVELAAARRNGMDWTEPPGDSNPYTSHVAFDGKFNEICALGIVPFLKVWDVYARGGISPYRWYVARHRLSVRQEPQPPGRGAVRRGDRVRAPPIVALGPLLAEVEDVAAALRPLHASLVVFLVNLRPRPAEHVRHLVLDCRAR